MTKKDDGGPAFPNSGGSDSVLYASYGMFLRDWFAGQALSAMGVSLSEGLAPGAYPIQAARAAYNIADAMLAERKKDESQ